MVNFVPQPFVKDILPPFLAHLPTAGASPRPPPSLLPLLAPILRQRVELLSSSGAHDSSSWLSLLTWSSPEQAEELLQLIRSQDFELHPSGEIEIEEGTKLDGIRRLDREEVQARVVLADRGWEMRYIWVANDPNGEDDGWKILDLRILPESATAQENWWPSVPEADEAYFSGNDGNEMVSPTVESTIQTHPVTGTVAEDDEDAYWAQYDDTPAATPAPDAQREPQRSSLSQHVRTTSEDEYYARYASVEPALDRGPQQATDVSSTKPIDIPNAAPTVQDHSPALSSARESFATSPPTTISASYPKDSPIHETHMQVDPPTAEIPSPKALPAHPNTVPALEASANLTERSLEEPHIQCETAVKQHVATTMKSLYRLCRSTGIDMAEFQRLVATEVACIGLEDQND